MTSQNLGGQHQMLCGAAAHPSTLRCGYRQAQADGEGLAAYLGTCFRALDESGSAWESARRANDFLTLLLLL